MKNEVIVKYKLYYADKQSTPNFNKRPRTKI